MIVDVLALIASFITLLITFSHEKKLNSINLLSNFYLDIYKDFLVDTLPEARERLQFINNKLTGQTQLINELGKMKRKSMFFRYTKPVFYKKLKKEIDNLEQTIADNCNRISDSDDQEKFNKEITDKLTSMYDLICNSLTDNSNK